MTDGLHLTAALQTAESGLLELNQLQSMVTKAPVVACLSLFLDGLNRSRHDCPHCPGLILQRLPRWFLIWRVLSQTHLTTMMTRRLCQKARRITRMRIPKRMCQVRSMHRVFNCWCLSAVQLASAILVVVSAASMQQEAGECMGDGVFLLLNQPEHE